MAKRKVEIEIKARDKASKTLKALATGAIAGIGLSAALSAKQLGATLGRELVQLSKLIIEIGAGFEKSMSGVKAITRGTATEMASLEKVARNLGKSTVFTAVNAAEAMEQFSLAGFSVNETLKATPAALDLAAAGQLSMAEAADITSNALRQFNIDASETTRVVDVIAGTATTSNQTVRDMGQALTFAGITADALGVSLEETAALLGKLADRGLKASLGGTALRRSFAVFMGQLEPGEEGLKGFNAALAKNEDGSFSFAKALDQLRDSGITSGDVMKAFGQRAGPAMVALLGLGGEAISGYTDDIRDMGGVAKQVAEDRLDNLTDDMKLLTSALTESAVIISKELIPALRTLVGVATEVVTIFNNLAARGRPLNQMYQNMAIGVQVLAIREIQAAKAGLAFLEALAFITPGVSAPTAAIRTLNAALTELQDNLGKGIGESFAKKFPAPTGALPEGGEAPGPGGGGLPGGGGGAAPGANLPQNRVAGFLEFQGPQQFLEPSEDEQGPSLEAFLDAEERKQEAIRATAQVLIESKLLIAETEEEALEIQVELEILAFEEELERLGDNKEAIENLEASHQNKMDALSKRVTDAQEAREKAAFREKMRRRQLIADATFASLVAVFGKSKTIATAQAIVNTALAVTSALKMEPFIPVGVASAVLAAALGIAEIRTIQSAKFAHGGLVTGGVPGVDSVSALLTPGEVVIPAPIVQALNRTGGTRGEDIGGDVFSAGGGGGEAAGNTFVLNIGGEASELDPEEVFGGDLLRELSERLSDFTKSQGGEVVASHILQNGVPVTANDLVTT